MFYFDTLEIEVPEKEPIVNLNTKLTEAVDKSGVRNGMVVAQSLHTTAGLVAQEDEEGIIQHDLPWFLNHLFPEREYAHDDLVRRQSRIGPDERKNGKAHLEQLFTSHLSLTLIVKDYKIQWGTWVSVLLVDFDPAGRKARRVAVAVQGE